MSYYESEKRMYNPNGRPMETVFSRNSRSSIQMSYENNLNICTDQDEDLKRKSLDDLNYLLSSPFDIRLSHNDLKVDDSSNKLDLASNSSCSQQEDHQALFSKIDESIDRNCTLFSNSSCSQQEDHQALFSKIGESIDRNCYYEINKTFSEKKINEYLYNDQNKTDYDQKVSRKVEFLYNDQNKTDYDQKVTRKINESSLGRNLVDTKRSSSKKIKLEYIQSKTKRATAFSKRKAGIIRKANDLAIMTGAKILLLVVNERDKAFSYVTISFKPVISKHKKILEDCFNGNIGENNSKDKSKFC